MINHSGSLNADTAFIGIHNSRALNKRTNGSNDKDRDCGRLLAEALKTNHGHILVDDNYCGRLKAFSGRVREAELLLDLRTHIEARRHPRQDNHRPPDAQIQTTPQQAQLSSISEGSAWRIEDAQSLPSQGPARN